MDQQKIKRLIETYPEFFKDTGASWLECPDGWNDLIADLFEELNHYIRQSSCKPISVSQIKQKHGSLRIIYAGGDEESHAIIGKYCLKSLELCTVCGKPGDLVKGDEGERILCFDHKAVH